MNEGLLKEILSCPSLPSLPQVAVKVIELTSDKNVRVPELASTVQCDQGLSAKILKTVNSSFYGVRTRVATIEKAIVMLGLAPVKVLALGFSLVASVGAGSDGFDYVAYWRRGLYSATAAKFIAEAAKAGSADESFLGGLLQDIGMMALFRALGKDYLEVVRSTGGDHRKLARAELEAFDVQHADIGAMLCQRWRLPDELVLPVKFHERPTAAPVEHGIIVRCVAMGNLVHDVLTDEDPTPAMRKLYERGAQWFELKASEIDAVVRRVGDTAKELSSLFKLDVGPFGNAAEVLAKAEAGRAALMTEVAQMPGVRPGIESLLLSADDSDPLTGLAGRKAFEAALRAGERNARSSGGEVSLVQVTLDNLRTVMNRCGEAGGDEVTVAMAAALSRAFAAEGATVCRLAGEVFAVVLESCGRSAAATRAEAFRSAVQNTAGLQVAKGLPIQVSIGVASIRAGETIEQLVGAAMKALREARATGHAAAAA
jgi:diguanylate cyclase (GGDEF)-like protein